MMERPAIIIACFIMCAIIILLLINMIKYNWKNGEFKVRAALMLWAVFKLLHIISMYYHKTHGWWMLLSLGAMLWVLIRHYLKPKMEHETIRRGPQIRREE